uniref:Uncharacterized protein n=1 Tax=Amphimedon queenslandica TaxID=400682 RepID=A0A1X7U887_AMPQE
MTESELLEYQLFLKKLQSSSSGRVVTVATAPSDRCSSYLKHNHSKVGVESVIAMTTSTSSLNEELRPSLSSGSLTGKGRGAVIVKSGDDGDDDKRSNDVSKTGDLIIEETDEWIPPTDEQGPLPSSAPITSHYKEDIGIEECNNEEDLSITDSGVNGYQSKPQSSLRRNESRSSRRNRFQSTEKNNERSRFKRNGSGPNRNESQPERSEEYQTTANLSSVSNELTLVGVGISEEKEEEEGEDFPQAMERDSSKNINNEVHVLHEMERGEEEQEEEDRVEGAPEIPLLRVKSTTSLYVPDYEYLTLVRGREPLLHMLLIALTVQLLLDHLVLCMGSHNQLKLKSVLPSGGVQLACADLLIRKGANIDQQAIDGSTALHSASVVGSVSFIQLLLMNGANPNAIDNDSGLPLHWATITLGHCITFC